MMDGRPSLRASSMNDLISKLRDGAIRPLIHGRLRLSGPGEAHRMPEERRVIAAAQPWVAKLADPPGAIGLEQLDAQLLPPYSG